MKHYVGLDVSMEGTKVYVMDGSGEAVFKGSVSIEHAHFHRNIIAVERSRSNTDNPCGTLFRAFAETNFHPCPSVFDHHRSPFPANDVPVQTPVII